MEYLVLSGNEETRRKYSGTPDEVLRSVYADFDREALLTVLPWEKVERADGYDAVLLRGYNPSRSAIRHLVSDIAKGHPDCYDEDVFSERTGEGLLLVNTCIDRLDFVGFFPERLQFEREYFRFSFSPVVVPWHGNVNHRDNRGLTPLMTAARAGAVTVMSELMRMGAEVDERSYHGITALMYAAGYSRDIRTVRLLLSAGADVDARDKNNWTPLQYAAGYNPAPSFMQLLLSHGARTDLITTNEHDLLMNACWSNESRAVIELILDLGFDAGEVRRKGRFEGSPLSTALSGNRNPEVVKLLMERGADPFFRFRSKKSLLSFAAGHNTDPDKLRLLMEAGISVNARDKNGTTALMEAAASNPSRESMRLLLEKGSDIGATDLHGRTALYFAERSCNEMEIRDILVENGACRFETDPYILVGSASLRELEDYAAREDLSFKTFAHLKGLLPKAAMDNTHADVIEALLDAGAGINSRITPCEATALHYAVSCNKNPEIARLLIDRGADLESRDTEGCTPIFYAIASRRADMVKLLTSRGADVMAVDSYGFNVLSIAARVASLSPDVIRALLDAGAEVDGTYNGITALMYASGSDASEEIIKELLSHGADINKRDRSGRTALMHYAAFGEKTSTCELLLHAGADPGLFDNSGKTAYQIALAREDGRTIVKAFAECGVNDKETANFLDSLRLRGNSLPDDGPKVFSGYSIDYEYSEEDGVERIRAMKDALVLGERTHLRTDRFFKATVVETLCDDGVEALCCCAFSLGTLLPVHFIMPAVRPSYLNEEIVYFQGTGYLEEGKSGIYGNMEEAWRALYGDGSYKGKGTVIELGDGRTGRILAKVEGFYRKAGFYVVEAGIDEGSLPLVVPFSYLEKRPGILSRLESGLPCFVSGSFYVSGDASYGQYSEGTVLDEGNLLDLLAYSIGMSDLSRVKQYLAPDCRYISENKELGTAGETLAHLSYSSRFHREQDCWYYKRVRAQKDGDSYRRGKEGYAMISTRTGKVPLVFFINEKDGQIKDIQFVYGGIEENWYMSALGRFKAEDMSYDLFLDSWDEWRDYAVPAERYLAIPLIPEIHEREYRGDIEDAREKARSGFQCPVLLTRRPWREVSASDSYDAVLFKDAGSIAVFTETLGKMGLLDDFFVTMTWKDALVIDLSGKRRAFADFFPAGDGVREYFRLSFEVLRPDTSPGL